jgi:hypothetical protein
LGEVSWKDGWGLEGAKELKDGGGKGRVLARYKEDLDGMKGGGRLEVFVAGDERVLDFVVASWVAVVKGEEREVEQSMEVLGDVLS